MESGKFHGAVLTFNHTQELLGVVAHTFNPSILEADAGELL